MDSSTSPHDCVVITDIPEAVREELECMLCLDIAENAVETRCCRKILCSECDTSSRQHRNICPQCRARNYKSEPAVTVRRMLNAFSAKCGLCKVDFGKYGDFESHKKNDCEEAEIECSNSGHGCSWKGKRKYLQSHISTSCQFTPQSANQAAKRLVGLNHERNLKRIERLLDTSDSNIPISPVGLHEELEQMKIWILHKDMSRLWPKIEAICATRREWDAQRESRKTGSGIHTDALSYKYAIVLRNRVVDNWNARKEDLRHERIAFPVLLPTFSLDTMIKRRRAAELSTAEREQFEQRFGLDL